MKKILVIGFSVTADSNGYMAVVKKHFANNDKDIVLDYCGVGGVTPFPLQTVFKLVNDRRGPYTHVFLEIATSLYPKTIRSIVFDGLDLLYDLLHQIQNTHTKISLINFYRDDFDYQYHYFDMLIESLCVRYQIPLLDLSSGLFNEKGREFCRTLLRDSVHTSEAGALFQGNEVIKFIREVTNSKLENKTIPAPRHRLSSIILADLPGKHTSDLFKRSGFEAPFISIVENTTAEFSFERKTKITGIGFLSGPKSGSIRVCFDLSPEEIIIDAYDEHCFYERYNFYRFQEPVWCTTLSLTQLPGVSEITLRRGDPDTGPRVGKIIAVHTMSRYQNQDILAQNQSTQVA